MESDACYFRRRADEEFSAAKSAACEHSRAAHFEMGERYAQLAAAIATADEQIGPPPQSDAWRPRSVSQAQLPREPRAL